MSSDQTVEKDEIATKAADGEAHITMEMLHAVDREESLSQRGYWYRTEQGKDVAFIEYAEEKFKEIYK